MKVTGRPFCAQMPPATMLDEAPNSVALPPSVAPKHIAKNSGSTAPWICPDMVGGDYIQDNISCSAEDGRIVQIAFLKGSKGQLDLMPVMLKHLEWCERGLRADQINIGRI
jgi:hypothetical protein